MTALDAPECSTAGPAAWHRLASGAALEALSVSLDGLDPAEATARLAEHGRNELVDHGSTSPWRLIWQQVSAVMVLILIVAGVQIASVVGANRAAEFTAEENMMLEGPLHGLGRAQARRMIDQGIWIDGREGDVLIREGEPAAQLYFLASGAGDVHSHGNLVGRVVPGQLIGEATVLGESAAIATVTITQQARFWCAQGRTLNAYLAANPDARHALEHSFTVSLRQKLDAMNRAAAPANNKPA